MGVGGIVPIRGWTVSFGSSEGAVVSIGKNLQLASPKSEVVALVVSSGQAMLSRLALALAGEGIDVAKADGDVVGLAIWRKFAAAGHSPDLVVAEYDRASGAGAYMLSMLDAEAAWAKTGPGFIVLSRAPEEAREDLVALAEGGKLVVLALPTRVSELVGAARKFIEGRATRSQNRRQA
jgi:hypothetical protein